MVEDLATELEPQLAGEERRELILIVDDDEVQAETLAHCLQRQGFRTEVRTEGKAAMQWALRHQPDLVVLDLRLPDVYGLEVCEHLVDSPRTCGTPVIIVSGVEQPDLVRQCRAAGSTYFLHKPYDPNALLSLIRCALDAHLDG